MTLMLGSAQLGLILGLLALGVYVTFRILDVPDLTADGSFTLGLAISALLVMRGRPFLALLCAALAGMAAGSVTGLLQTKLGIHPILSGILTMSGLYSVNQFVMGAPNLSLIGQTTLFTLAQSAVPGVDKDIVKLAVAALVAALALALLIWFFRTHVGMCIRATGDNEAMVRSSSINVDGMKIMGLALANGFVALSGAVIAQYQGFADISSGIGMVVVGLASVIIGELFLGRRGVTAGLTAAVLGSIAYRFVIALALKNSRFPAYMLKLVSAFIVVAALSFPVVLVALRRVRSQREVNRHA